MDKNIEDGGGAPARIVTFHVTAFGQVQGYGEAGESNVVAKLIATNDAPGLPSNFTQTVGFQNAVFSYDRPTIADWSGLLLWLDTSASFTPGASNLVYSGTDNKIVLSDLTSGDTYYYKYALTDTFVDPSQVDTTGLTLSGESSFTTNITVTSTEIESIIADKVAAGEFGEAISLAGVFVAYGTDAVLNGTGPALGTYRLDMGPVAQTGATYILNYSNGYDDAHGSYVSNFSVDESGNLALSGNVTITGGSGIASLSDAGSLATQDSISYRQSTVPSAPIEGDLWHNTNASTVSGVPSGSTGRYNGSTWDVTTDATLDALENTTTITGGGITLSSGGAINSVNKTSFANTDAGIYLGWDATESDYVLNIGDGANYFKWDGGDLDVTGNISGSRIEGSSFTTTGSYLTTATTGAETTINVHDTTDFSASGSGWILDSTNDKDAFAWTGKTATTLTGCSGVLAHSLNSLVTPQSDQIIISEDLNEMRFYGDHGSGTIVELVNIGITTVGSDPYVMQVGSNSGGSSVGGISVKSATKPAVSATSSTAQAVYGISSFDSGVEGYGTTDIGVKGTGAAVGVKGIALSGGNGVEGTSPDRRGVVATTTGTLTGAFKITPKSNTTDPTGGSRGEFYVRSDGTLRFHNGTSWVTIV